MENIRHFFLVLLQEICGLHSGFLFIFQVPFIYLFIYTYIFFTFSGLFFCSEVSRHVMSGLLIIFDGMFD